MPPEPARKPYLEAWLRRTGRELAASGRLSEAALLLSQRRGGTVSEWTIRLRGILERDEEPDFELLTEIDNLLARPGKNSDQKETSLDMFGTFFPEKN